MQSLLWQLFLFLIPILLNIATAIFKKILALVEEAETKTDLTGAQKREWVLTQVKEQAVFLQTEVPAWTFNALLEAAVSYVKSKGL